MAPWGCGGDELWWGWRLGCLPWSHWERIPSCLEICHSGPSLRAGPPHCRLFPELLLAWVPSRAMWLLGPWRRVSPRSGLDHDCPPGQNRPWAPRPCLSSPESIDYGVHSETGSDGALKPANAIVMKVSGESERKRSMSETGSWEEWGALHISFKTNVWRLIWCGDASNLLDYDGVRQHCFSARHSFKPKRTLIAAISSSPLASVIISYAPSLCGYNAKWVINSIM